MKKWISAILTVMLMTVLLMAIMVSVYAEDGGGKRMEVKASELQAAEEILPVSLEPKGEYIAGNTPLSGFEPEGKERLTRMWRSDISANFFGGTHYVWSSLPSWLKPDGFTSGCTMVMRLNGPGIQLWRPEKWALEFVSGDETMKNAFRFDEEGDGDEWRLRLWIDHYQINDHPGEATFRITLECDRYFLQEERTLRVANYEDEPLVYSPKIPVVFRMREGDSFFIDEDVDQEDPNDLVSIAAGRFLTEPNGPNVIMEVRRLKKMYGDTPLARMKGIVQNPTEDNWTFTFEKSGSYDVTIPLWYGNIRLDMPVRFCVAEETIAGPDVLSPGEEAEFTVDGTDMSYTWRLEGDGAEINRETGHLTVKENAEPGARLVITAKPKGKGTTLSVNLTIRTEEEGTTPNSK